MTNSRRRMAFADDGIRWQGCFDICIEFGDLERTENRMDTARLSVPLSLSIERKTPS